MADRELNDNLIGNDAKKNAFDIESEKALLSLCLKNSDVLDHVVSSRLFPEDFYDQRHQILFLTISKLYEDSQTIDPYTIIKKLQSDGILQKAGGNSYVMGLTDTYAIPSSKEDYVRIIKDASSRRKLIKTLDKIGALAKNGESSASDIADTAINELSQLRESREDEGFESLKDILKKTINDIYNVSTGKTSRRVIKTGFNRLDAKLGGLRPGTFNILAARPGMGKTALAINIAVNSASLFNTPVCIFSLEMSKTELGNRIIASRTEFTAKDLQYANFKEDKLMELYRGTKSLNELSIYVNDTSVANPASMISDCKRLKAEGKLGLVIIDYLQLMSLPDKQRSNMSRQAEVTEISRSLKVMAKELEVPILALSQLSRGPESREDHTPMLSDLRDSGAIEQDADSVWFIDRDNYYDKDGEVPNEQSARIIVAKNRHGSTGPIYLKWIGSKTLFMEKPDKNEPQEQPGTRPPHRQDQQSASASYSYPDESAVPDIPPMPPADYEQVPPPDYEPEPIMPGDEAPLENVANDEMFNDAETSDQFPEGLF
ncbi:MAG: replicative DNA helicase [Clostridiales bacterium]|nr:replicative DNA helicase [Clostridiales bacterium]